MVLSVAYLSAIQGAYYLGTGIWPLLHMRSFETVTGPKTDRWLVTTVGVLVAVIGAVLLVAGFHHEIGLEVLVLAFGSAIGLTAIDVWYVVRKVIAPIYLLDAVTEVALVVLWIMAERSSVT